MNGADPYRILEVDPLAEQAVILAAYRRLARKYHPDVATGPDAMTRMVEINQAWETLRDPVRRTALDRARARASTDAARVAAADAHEHTRSGARPGRPPAGPGQGAGPTDRPGSSPGPTWPIEGMQDVHGGFGDRTDRVSPDWSAGRSATGGGYDSATMGAAQGHGSAGRPPGNPSGALLTFGRYAGWTLGEIARSDLEYLEWLDRTPIGRIHHFEIDGLLRAHGRRKTAPAAETRKRGLFRRR